MTIEMDEAQMGPAMRRLASDKQRAFVLALAEGAANATVAARMAGYEDAGGAGAKRCAHRLAHDPKVMDALREVMRSRFMLEVPRSLRTVVEVRDAVGAKPADRVRAATALMDRAGMGPASEHHHTHEHVLTDGEKWARVIELARAQGKDPKVLLANLTPAERERAEAAMRTTDAEFEEITAPATSVGEAEASSPASGPQ